MKALRLDFRIGPAANAAFPLLYELFTATMTVEARKDLACVATRTNKNPEQAAWVPGMEFG